MESEFICKCGNLIYSDFKTKKEYCLNSACENHGDIKQLFNKKEEVEKRFESMKNVIKLKSKLFHSNFIKYLFVTQNYLFSRLYLGEGISIPFLLNLHYMIFLTKNLSLVGRDSRQKKFSEFLDSQWKTLETYLFYQDIKEDNIIIAKNLDSKKIYLKMKYLDTINKQKNNYGLVSNMDSLDNFRYNSIDLEKIEKKVFEVGGDNMEEFFFQFFPEMIKIDMITKFNYEFSKMFDRRINKYYIAGMLSLFFSSKEKNELSRISKKDFSKTLTQMDFNKEQIKTFFNFLKGEENQIPLAIVTPTELIYGKWTLFTMSLKYIGTLPEKPLVTEGKRTASIVFEEKIRDKLKERGYLVPFDKSIEIPKDSFDYDVIAIDKENKKINIIEAKYHDLPSSAFSGKNLLNIKLQDSEVGEINIARRQKERKDNLEKYKELLKEKSKLDIDLENYEIVPYIIFKFNPILSKLEGNTILSFDKMDDFF